MGQLTGGGEGGRGREVMGKGGRGEEQFYDGGCLKDKETEFP